MKNKTFEKRNNGLILPYMGKYPKIKDSVFICPGSIIVGDVEIGEFSSVWFNCVIRGDVHYIKIGEKTNIQDMSMLHVTNNKYALNIGNNVSIAHSVTLHGCTVEDDCLVGIGAIVLDNAVVGKNSLVAAGSLVRENWRVPEGTLVAGVPAKVIRDLTPEELIRVHSTTPNYIQYSKNYLGED